MNAVKAFIIRRLRVGIVESNLPICGDRGVKPTYFSRIVESNLPMKMPFVESNLPIRGVKPTYLPVDNWGMWCQTYRVFWYRGVKPTYFVESNLPIRADRRGFIHRMRAVFKSGIYLLGDAGSFRIAAC